MHEVLVNELNAVRNQIKILISHNDNKMLETMLPNEKVRFFF